MAGLTERERQIREERAQVWSGMEPLVEKFKNGEGSLTTEERADYFARDAKLIALDEDLKIVLREQGRESAQRELADTRGVSSDEQRSRDEQETRAFGNYLRYGNEGLTREDRGLLRPQASGNPGEALETRANPLATLPGAPAAGATLAGEGGYLVPQGFWHNLQIAMKAYGGTAPLFRQVRTSTGNPMPWPTMDPTGIVGSLLSENTQVTEVDFSFGQGMLSAWTYTSGLHLASIQIVNDSAFDVDSFVTDRVGESIGRAQAAAVINGTGSSQPLGLLTAITAKGAGSIGGGGIYTPAAAKPVFTVGSNTSTTELINGSPSFASILDMITFVDPAYRQSASWVMGDTTMQKLRAVSDTFGHPLWQPNVQVGGTAADSLYNYPVVIDNNMPGLVASTIGGPVFGSLSHAMVLRTVDQAGLLRLTERYADFLQVGFIGYMRFDSRSNDMRAVTAFKSAAT